MVGNALLKLGIIAQFTKKMTIKFIHKSKMIILFKLALPRVKYDFTNFHIAKVFICLDVVTNVEFLKRVTNID